MCDFIPIHRFTRAHRHRGYTLSSVQLLFKYELVKYDLTRDEPLKDQQGFCQRVDRGRTTPPQARCSLSQDKPEHLHLSPGETGLLLSKVSAISPFFGYAGSKSLTEKKLLRNVFAKGDVYFNTGDLMAEDQQGFISFRDRVGDTFRWEPPSPRRF